MKKMLALLVRLEAALKNAKKVNERLGTAVSSRALSFTVHDISNLTEMSRKPPFQVVHTISLTLHYSIASW